jgi:hypothetical protein
MSVKMYKEKEIPIDIFVFFNVNKQLPYEPNRKVFIDHDKNDVDNKMEAACVLDDRIMFSLFGKLHSSFKCKEFYGLSSVLSETHLIYNMDKVITQNSFTINGNNVNNIEKLNAFYNRQDNTILYQFKSIGSYIILPSRNKTTNTDTLKDLMFGNVFGTSSVKDMYYVLIWYLKKLGSAPVANYVRSALQGNRDAQRPIRSKFVRLCTQEPKELTYSNIHEIRNLDYSDNYCLPKSDGLKSFIFIHRNKAYFFTLKDHINSIRLDSDNSIKGGHNHNYGQRDLYASNEGEEAVLVEGELIKENGVSTFYPYYYLDKHSPVKHYNELFYKLPGKLEKDVIEYKFNIKLEYKELIKLSNSELIKTILEGKYKHPTDGIIIIPNQSKNYPHFAIKYKPLSTIDVYLKAGSPSLFCTDKEGHCIPLSLVPTYDKYIISENISDTVTKDGIYEIYSKQTFTAPDTAICTLHVLKERPDKVTSNPPVPINNLYLNMLFPLTAEMLFNKFEGVAYFDIEKRLPNYAASRKVTSFLTRDLLEKCLDRIDNRQSTIVDFGAANEKFFPHIKPYLKQLIMLDNDKPSCSKFIETTLGFNESDELSKYKYIISDLREQKSVPIIRKSLKDKINVVMCMYSVHYYFESFVKIMKELKDTGSFAKQFAFIFSIVDLAEFDPTKTRNGLNEKYAVKKTTVTDKANQAFTNPYSVKLAFTNESIEDRMSSDKILQSLAKVFKITFSDVIPFTSNFIKNRAPFSTPDNGFSISFSEEYKLLDEDDIEWCKIHKFIYILCET